MDPLMRSSRDLNRPVGSKMLGALETLEIFGVRADYMKRFREILEIEGISKTFDAVKKVATRIRVPASPPLKILRAKGPSFIEARSEVILDATRNGVSVLLDWYPRVLSYGSVEQNVESANRRTAALTPLQVSFVDLDRVHAAMITLKRSRRWDNLVIPRDVVDILMSRHDWYTLYASEDMLRPSPPSLRVDVAEHSGSLDVFLSDAMVPPAAKRV